MRNCKFHLKGDERTEDNVILTSIQTIFLRVHNFIAKELKKVNPDWTPNQVYQEARKIQIAQYQNIIYGEYLPALLGDRITKLYKLLPFEEGFLTDYNDGIYPQIINEFSSAAFRYGHSLLTLTHQLADKQYRLSEPAPLYNYIFNNQLYNSSMNDVVRGSLLDWSYYPNPQINSYLNDWLFEGLFYGDSKRWSLSALNIQRGRDHGVAPYNKYRQLCGLNRAHKFTDFNNIPPYQIEKLKKSYATPDDVDLYAGIFSEYPVKGGMLGATGAC